MRLVLLSALALWAGTALLLTHVRWFRRRPLADRLRPYSPGGSAVGAGGGGVLSVSSFREVIAPLARSAGERLSRLFGASEALATSLERVRADEDVTAFRLRQLGWSIAGFVVTGALCVALAVPGVVGAALTLGGGALGFLVVEQRLTARSRDRQHRLFLELAVFAEQIGMLLSAGYSVGASLNRVAGRGRGVVAEDLAMVCGRMRQGLSEVEALREWAALAKVDAVDRLVAVLALNRDAGDLGRLISEEARSIRRDVQRKLIETIERREQMVWIPVTVATLVPGVLFIAVPFIEALRVFSLE